jgi:hypothetical protein
MRPFLLSVSMQPFAETFPLLVAALVVVIVVIFSIGSFRYWAADAARAWRSADSESRIRERYLDALKQTSVTHALAIVLSIIAVLLVVAGLTMLKETWQQSNEAIAFLISGAGVGALAAIAFSHAASNRRHLATVIEAVRTDWRLSEAVRIAEALVVEREVRTRLLTALALHLSGMVTTPAAARQFASRQQRSEGTGTRNYYEWRQHFRRSGRRRGRRLVLERDYLSSPAH